MIKLTNPAQLNETCFGPNFLNLNNFLNLHHVRQIKIIQQGQRFKYIKPFVSLFERKHVIILKTDENIINDKFMQLLKFAWSNFYQSRIKINLKTTDTCITKLVLVWPKLVLVLLFSFQCWISIPLKTSENLTVSKSKCNLKWVKEQSR